MIGGGPAGIAAVSQLLALSAHFSITLFERRPTFGGIWCYDADPGACTVRFDSAGKPYALWEDGKKDGDVGGKFRPPGAMYDGLRTNLPCDIMAYRSAPFASATELFPDRRTVEEYLQTFAKDVLEGSNVDVRLRTAVNDVRRISHDPIAAKEGIGRGSVWKVSSVHTETDKPSSDEYDHIILASGRCNTPTIPAIANLHRFTGRILHSAWYRSPLPFEGQTVLVVGNSSSGSDIARELAGYVVRTLPEGQAATSAFVQRCHRDGVKGKVLHSYEHVDQPPPLDFDPRHVDSPEWCSRIRVVPKIQAVSERGQVVLEGGETLGSVDVMMFGTGYVYDFPYLDQRLEPFADAPLIPPPPPGRPSVDVAEPYLPPHRTAPFLSNLDDWSLFYSPDPSLCVLGAPIRIVPMPLTHVQSRIVAAAWSGLLPTALPRLDPTLPTTNPAKWSSTSTTPHHNANTTSDLGYPSDSAYQDALLHLLPPHLRESGKDEQTKVPHQAQTPITANDEGWSRMPDYRNQRRQDTKRLRRILLGY